MPQRRHLLPGPTALLALMAISIKPTTVSSAYYSQGHLHQLPGKACSNDDGDTYEGSNEGPGTYCIIAMGSYTKQ